MFYSYGITSSAGFLIPITLYSTTEKRVTKVALFALSAAGLAFLAQSAPALWTPLEAGIGAFAGTLTLIALESLNVRKKTPNLKMTALAALVLALPAALSAPAAPKPFTAFCINGIVTLIVKPDSTFSKRDLAHLALVTLSPIIFNL